MCKRSTQRTTQTSTQRSTKILSDVNGLEDSIIKMLILPVGSMKSQQKLADFFLWWKLKVNSKIDI